MVDGGIGVFDSGIGGLTLLKELDSMTSGQTFYYYGDNSNAPYGNKSAEEILSLSSKAFECFDEIGVRAAVIACNTVTADCAAYFRKKFSYKIFGIEPALKPALLKHDDVLVLATKATLSSPSFMRLKNSFYGKNIMTFAPIRLAEDIERNIPFGRGIDLSAHLKKVKTGAVVLGCTHYVYLKKEIGEFYSSPVFDGNYGISIHLVKCLTLNKAECGIKADNMQKNNIIFIGNDKNYNCFVYKHMFGV